MAAGANGLLLIGAPFNDSPGAENAGAAYLFDGDPASGEFGQLLKTFRKPDPSAGDLFGAAVAGSGLIGAPFDDGGADNAGAVYLFDTNRVGPRFGALLRTIRQPAPAAGDRFGAALAAAGGSILVGAPGDSRTAPGAAYLFDADARLQPFFNPSPEEADRFGAAVALTEGYVAVGAPGDDSGAPDAGIAYGFNACNPCGPTGCGNLIVESGEDCDDGNLENGDGCDNDCKLSRCVGGDQKCDDGNACTTDRCDPVRGCVRTPLDCDDGVVCTEDTCDPRGGCVHSMRANCCRRDEDCRDTNVCNGSETCRPCVGCGLHVYPCCRRGATCVDGMTQPDETSCEDGNMCTVGDRCVAGDCTAGSQKICTALDQCHDPGTCVPATGVCSNPIRDGSCSDGDRCTLNDTCLGGVCQGTPVVCTPLDQCHDAGTCIAATGACSNPPRDGPCDDGNSCTRTDMCQNGTCRGGDPVVCTPLDDCHDAGVCNPATGVCTNPVKLRCPCTHDDECDDADPCTDDSCRGGDCAHTDNAASCDDGIACTEHDVCREGSCHGTPNAGLCDDHDVCTTDRCDPAHGCVRTPNTASCDDGIACTENDVCRDGSCLGTPNASLCDDHNACTTDRCDSPLGCLHVNNADPCDDGNSCTGDGTCHDGTCTPGRALGCFVGVRCACDPGLRCGAEVVPSKVKDPFSRACGLVTTAQSITANLTIGQAQRLRMAKGKVASAGKALKASLAAVRKARVKTARTKISGGCAEALTGKISAVQGVVRNLRADFTACSANTRGIVLGR